MSLERLDKLLVDGGFVQSRAQAQKLISAGAVKAKLQGQWVSLHKPAQKFDSTTVFQTESIEELKYVSRAGLKLEGALNQLAHSTSIMELLNTCNVAIDVGQSTGGFTDCLLQFGVTKVVGVDVGHGQLVEKLRGDPRVLCLEGINARDLDMSLFAGVVDDGFDLAVMDVSFISQTLVVAGLSRVVKNGGHVLALVKPQFEVGQAGLAKGGLVKDESWFSVAKQKVTAAYARENFVILDYFASQLPGTDGNREFFIFAQKKSSNQHIAK